MGWERWGSSHPRLALEGGVTSRSNFLSVRGMVADVSFEGPGAQEPQELHPSPVHMSILPRPSPNGVEPQELHPPPIHKYTDRDSVCS